MGIFNELNAFSPYPHSFRSTLCLSLFFSLLSSRVNAANDDANNNTAPRRALLLFRRQHRRRFFFFVVVVSGKGL